MTKNKNLFHRSNRFVRKMREDINNPRDAFRAAIYGVTRGSRTHAAFYLGLFSLAGIIMSRGHSGMPTSRLEHNILETRTIDLNDQRVTSKTNYLALEAAKTNDRAYTPVSYSSNYK